MFHMRAKNLYQCDLDCKTCTYEKRNPTGFTSIDECGTDNCPLNKYKIGNVDKLGGRHAEGYGWNPLGEFCNFCKHETCEDCIKWSNRDKKLRNNIPPELKKQKVEKKVDEAQPNNDIEKVERTPVDDIVARARAIMAKEQGVYDNKNTSINEQDNTFVNREMVADNAFDDFDSSDFSNNYTQNNEKQVVLMDTTNGAEDIDDTEDEDIDFDIEISTTTDEDDFSNVTFGDDIPAPDSFASEIKDDNEDDDDDEENTETDEDDDDDDEYDEDDDAEFEMYEPTKKLKASLLFSNGTKIAKYQVRNKGVYLTVDGDAKVTVKGRNDSDGFSYCDPNRFPRYIREGIMSGDIFENNNIKVTDNSYFCIVHFDDIDGDIIEKQKVKCLNSYPDISEEKIRKMLYKALNGLIK